MKTFKQFMTEPDPEDGTPSMPIRRYKHEVWHGNKLVYGTDNHSEYKNYKSKNKK
jgi:hypothetical protein